MIMDTFSFWNVLIPALSAILVASVPALISYFGIKAQLRATEKKDQEDREAHKDEIIQVIEKHNAEQDDTLRCMLRTEILKLYFKHMQRDDLELVQWEAENERSLYEQYKKLNGNSFVDDLHKEIKKWPIVRDHKR